MLTAAATLITAISGLLAFLYQAGILVGAEGVPKRPTVASLAGSWSGPVQEASATYEMTVDIRESCVLNAVCGAIALPHVPCYGEISLQSEMEGDFEFRVDRFDARSNAAKCTPGAGEHFRLMSDGKLQYWASYSEAKGVLTRNSSRNLSTLAFNSPSK
jgi:hypothetical protein